MRGQTLKLKRSLIARRLDVLARCVCGAGRAARCVAWLGAGGFTRDAREAERRVVSEADGAAVGAVACASVLRQGRAAAWRKRIRAGGRGAYRWLLAVLLLALLPVFAQAAAEAPAPGGFGALWQTPDQRGSALLRRGDASGAARNFQDPRWRAYADLQAGHYAEAAKGFSAFDDADALYNRGNALARAGDLQGALAAYDAALKKAPEDHDARHNRDLVEKALQKHKAQQQGGQSGASGKQGQKDGQRGGQGQKGGKSQDGQNGQAGNDGKGSQNPDGGQGGQQPQGQNSGGEKGQRQGQDGKSASTGAGKESGQQDRKQGGQQAQAAGAQPTPDGKSGASASPQPQSGEQGGVSARQAAKADAEQARKDAQAALAGLHPRAGGQQAAQPQPGKRGTEGGADGDLPAGQAAAAAHAPTSERQMALDQWLQRIPEDPGGLLRRKFLIEHLMNQQKAQP